MSGDINSHANRKLYKHFNPDNYNINQNSYSEEVSRVTKNLLKSYKNCIILYKPFEDHMSLYNKALEILRNLNQEIDFLKIEKLEEFDMIVNIFENVPSNLRGGILYNQLEEKIWKKHVSLLIRTF